MVSHLISFTARLSQSLGADARTRNNENRVSIIDILSSKWNGLPIEVKQIKKHWFKKFINESVDKKGLKIRENGHGIIDLDVVDYN